MLHRPRRYESAVDEIAFSQLWGDGEVAIAGVVVSVRTRRIGGRRTIVTAQIKDASGSVESQRFALPYMPPRIPRAAARRAAQPCRDRISSSPFRWTVSSC